MPEGLSRNLSLVLLSYMKVHASCPPAATSTTYRPEFLSLRHEIEHVDAPRGWAEAFFFLFFYIFFGKLAFYAFYKGQICSF